MAGGAMDEAGRREGTPRGELGRIRASRDEQESDLRSGIATAVLETCGERGFRATSVQDVIDRYGGNRVQFYRHFANKADAYAAAYEAEIEGLCERVLGAGRTARGWRPGLRAGLCELASFLAERPLAASGLLVEVHVAGGPALAKRAEVYERLAAAIDGARREVGTGPELPSPPPLTARFMLGAIDSAASSALARGEAESFAATVPELAHMVVAGYYGEETAVEELAAASGPPGR